jgi:formamidopyrimidine-DNA glycosylase
MPELPEVEIVKRSLLKIANKAKIIDIKIKNKNLRYKIPKFFRKKLLNNNILRVSRRSKYIIFHFKNKLLLMHLGMTGKLLFFKKKYIKIFKTSFYYDLNIFPKHNHIFFMLSNNLTLVYNDVRRFGFFKLYENKKLDEISFLSKLGIEPLSKKFNYEYFKKIIRNRKKNIKNILMDQSLICGLGNIYVNEALFLAKVNPLRLSYSLKKKELKNIIKNIKLILKLSIIKGGSSIKDFQNTSGKSGKFQQFFNVYGRNNKNCSRVSCTGEIKKILISNRSSFYCSSCQK